MINDGIIGFLVNGKWLANIGCYILATIASHTKQSKNQKMISAAVPIGCYLDVHPFVTYHDCGVYPAILQGLLQC